MVFLRVFKLLYKLNFITFGCLFLYQFALRFKDGNIMYGLLLGSYASFLHLFDLYLTDDSPMMIWLFNHLDFGGLLCYFKYITNKISEFGLVRYVAADSKWISNIWIILAILAISEAQGALLTWTTLIMNGSHFQLFEHASFGWAIYLVRLGCIWQFRKVYDPDLVHRHLGLFLTIMSTHIPVILVYTIYTIKLVIQYLHGSTTYTEENDFAVAITWHFLSTYYSALIFAANEVMLKRQQEDIQKQNKMKELKKYRVKLHKRLKALPHRRRFDAQECSICYLEFEDASTYSFLPCGHKFHDGCIEAWLIDRKCCPMCLVPFTLDMT